ncbi:uncharacterized protein LOC115968080 [Quercus lobata]|uniref:uncharacterized protein LOC115968080 n=1 Tax=Quercus lobata TaxID=97700 RepID=UPI001247C930|nr:uncharacterized protein LOC115968080 [Quercus lobata]
MDQATTGELLHFHLTTYKDDESSTSVTRSDILEECVRAFKSTPRSAWKMGLDLRGIFEKLCAAWGGGSEDERREEDSGFQIPVAISPVSMDTEKGSCSSVPVCSPSSVAHSRVSQWSSKAKNRFWAFQCFLLWPKDFPARKPHVISLLLMSPSLEPKKKDPKNVNMQTQKSGLLGLLRGVACNCL